MKLLVIVDMQKDFIDGALGSPEAVAIVPYVKELIQGFDGKVFFTAKKRHVSGDFVKVRIEEADDFDLFAKEI